MHNGVGLPTARGSGTSGRVQSNKFLARPRPPSSAAAGAPREPPGCGGGFKEMAEHERRRAVEVRLLELHDAPEEQGYTDAEIDSRLAEARKAAANADADADATAAAK